jgi:RNA polymerase sigma-70 factor (family 1)
MKPHPPLAKLGRDNALGPANDDKVKPLADGEAVARRLFGTDPRKGLEHLFRLHYASLCSHAVRYVYARQVAEDLVSDVFYQFWQKKHYEHIQTSYCAYLFAAVRNRVLNYLRHEFSDDNGQEIPENFAPAGPASPQLVMQYEELLQKIGQGIAELPPQCQRVFVMSRFEGKKNKEVAEELGVSLKAVEGHLTKALGTLRAVLARQGLLSMVVGFIFYLAKLD